MTLPRTLHTVSGQRPTNEAQIHAWGSTGGGGSPTLNTPSWGTASITDAGVGLLDVSFERAMGSANYYASASPMDNSTAFFQCDVDNTTAPAAGIVRYRCKDAANTATDPQLGWTWLIAGI